MNFKEFREGEFINMDHVKRISISPVNNPADPKLHWVKFSGEVAPFDDWCPFGIFPDKQSAVDFVKKLLEVK